MKYLLVIILSLVICTISVADNLIGKVKTKYDKITTIRGDFSQTICSENLGTCQQFEGKFAIARPYFSRLEVTNPEKQLLIADSQNSYIHLINQKKVYIQTANTGINFFRVFDMFLDDTAKFIITNQDSIYVILSYQQDTLAEATMFNDLTLHINKQTLLIEQFSFTDMTGAEMKFELTNIKINPKLSSKLFKFEIPIGVEILRY